MLSPQEPLVTGGPAEEFEARVQALFRDGFRHLLADLRFCPSIDSAGIRALVRGHTTAQRLHGTFCLVGPNERVRTVLELSRLYSVFSIYDSFVEAKAVPVHWDKDALKLVAAATTLSAALLLAGAFLPSPDVALSPFYQPFEGLFKLVASALIGVMVTAVHRRYRVERSQSQSMDQAQVLLCVSGAMMMIIIGNSLARAFGIAGAASIIRFRTPVEDPKDITILFLLMGLGMAAGLGAFGIAGLGTVFLCVCLVLLDRFGERRTRTMLVEITAEGRDFPMAHVQNVFARNRVVFEPREVSQGKETVVQYQATLNPGDSMEDLSAQLMAGGTAGVKAVSWEPAKKPI